MSYTEARADGQLWNKEFTLTKNGRHCTQQASYFETHAWSSRLPLTERWKRNTGNIMWWSGGGGDVRTITDITWVILERSMVALRKWLGSGKLSLSACRDPSALKESLKKIHLCCTNSQSCNSKVLKRSAESAPSSHCGTWKWKASWGKNQSLPNIQVRRWHLSFWVSYSW